MIPFGTACALANKTGAKKEQAKMKSVIIDMCELARYRTLALLTAVICQISSPLAFADGGTWSLDPTTSSARLFQGVPLRIQIQ
jgi:hypothetical protein